MVFSNVNGASSAKGTASVSATSSERKFPDDKTLKKAAEQLGISVEDLKAHLKKSPTASGKGIYNLAITMNEMDMKAFCILNGIDHSKWRDYTVKSGEQFYVINKPAQYKGNTSAKVTTPAPAQATTPAPAADTAKKAETKPVETQKPDSTAKKDTTSAPKQEVVRDPSKAATTSAAENRRKWNSDYTPAELGQKIYEFADDNSKAVGRPDFDALIEQINSKNVTEVLLQYNDNPDNKKESLINTITSETGSKPEDRKAAVMHIYDALAKATNSAPENRTKFENELNARFEDSGFVDTERMEDMLLRMIGTPEIIASQLEKEVDDNRGAVGTETFNEVLNLINKDNVAEVIAAYDKLDTGESIFEAIADETSSDSSDRQKAIGHVFDAYADSLGTPEKVRELFKAELKEQAEGVFPMNTATLDKYINYMTASPKEIAKEMEALIDDNLIKGAVDERDFQVLLNLVTPKNALEVVLQYKSLNTGESLIEAITSESGDGKQVRKDAVMHIYDTLSERTFGTKEYREEFVKELDDEFNGWGFVDTENLDNMINRLINGSGDDMKTRYTPTYDKNLPPAGQTKAEQKGQQILKDARRDREKHFYEGVRDSRTGQYYPSFREVLIQRIQDDPTLSKEEKEIEIAKARWATVDVSTITRPTPKLDGKGNIVQTPEVKELAPIGKSNGKCVIVNTGHGGFASAAFDAGTFSYLPKEDGSNEYYAVEEYDIATNYSEDLIQRLRKQGYTVVTLQGRVDVMDNSRHNTVENLTKKYKTRFGADKTMFVSLHCNSSRKPETTGSVICYNDGDSRDSLFAQTLYRNLGAQEDIMMKDTTAVATNSYVLRASQGIPSALLEIDYMTGPDSGKLVDPNYQDQFISATFSSIEEYFEQK
ncbi:N-acetylmuramoyl-L-alanine amidase [bacterium]|nr:N-acetylmuramoyl-L-alanine amidase [bacterium]